MIFYFSAEIWDVEVYWEEDFHKRCALAVLAKAGTISSGYKTLHVSINTSTCMKACCGLMAKI